MKNLLLNLSTNDWMRKRVSRSRLARRVAGRFVGGETIAEAVAAARKLRKAGMETSLDFLGESVASLDEAVAARDEYLSLLQALKNAGVGSHVSLKPSQLGLAIDPDACLENIQQVVETAAAIGTFVRVDMEESGLTQKTLDLFGQLAAKFDNVGIVLQACLYRSMEDVPFFAGTAKSIRLCKGAYLEPESVAFPKKADVDNNYVALMRVMLEATSKNGSFWPALATHDEKMIDATIEAADALDLAADRYEFQMLYGIRRDLQAKLAQRGYRMRVYIPYGTHWYPYLMRRMAERPANLLFVLKNLFR